MENLEKYPIYKGECIIWDGPKWAQGRYGMDTIDGKSMGAHKAAWIRKYGEIEPGLVVCHKCDNGLCVNTDHLFLGTLSDNMQDCIKKGRFHFETENQQGANNHHARKDYHEIREKAKNLIANGFTYSQTKQALGIKSNGHLRKILTS